MLVKHTGRLQDQNYIPPPIPLRVKEETKPNKGEFVKIDLKSNPANEHSKTYSFQIKLVSHATPEEILKFIDNFNMIVRGQNITMAEDKFGMMRNLLREDCLRVFEQGAVEAGEVSDQSFLTCVHKLVTYCFPKNALAIQKRYMRRFLRKPRDMKIREFYVRVLDLRNRQNNFPPFAPDQKMGMDELKEIVEFGCPSTWQKEIYRQGFDVSSKTLEQLIDFYERMETTEDIYGSHKNAINQKGKTATGSDAPEKHRGSYQTAQRNNQSKRNYTTHNKRKHSNEDFVECPIHGMDHSQGGCKVLRDQGTKMREQWLAQKKKPYTNNKYVRRSDEGETKKPKFYKREANVMQKVSKSACKQKEEDGDDSSEASDINSADEELYNFSKLHIAKKNN
jgi:hypothetical protein